MECSSFLYVVWWLTLAASGTQKCKTQHEYRMLTANCFDQDWEEIPPNIDSDTEIIYAPKNRIRQLVNSSLQGYTNLKMLYLADNFISKIEAGVFSESTKLEVLDLTRNLVRNLPTDLPLRLRTLYLAQNTELPDNLTLSAAYNLAVLSLAECSLHRLPNLGFLPNLKELNLTGNPLASVTPADLAPLCRLQTVYLPPSLFREPGSECQCHRLLSWAFQHHIHLPAYNCTALVDPNIASCNTTVAEEVAVYDVCLAIEPPPDGRNYLLTIAVACCLALACLVLLCWWRKGRSRHNSVQDNRPVKNTKAQDTLIM